MKIADVRQRGSDDCGVCAVSAGLQSIGVDLSPEQLRNIMLTNSLDGTDPRAIETALRQYCGVNVIAGEMDLEDVKSFTDRGKPVVAVIPGHYVTIGSVSDGGDRARVAYHDPLLGEVHMQASDFVLQWSDLGRMGEEYNQFGIAFWARGVD